jgi:hypothetical protein
MRRITVPLCAGRGQRGDSGRSDHDASSVRCRRYTSTGHGAGHLLWIEQGMLKEQGKP